MATREQGIIPVRARPPVLPQPVEARMPPVLRHVLRNGLEVHIVEQRVLPVVDVRFVARAGAGCDDPALAGRAYLMADLLDEGTVTRGALDIAAEAELLGASLATRASWDFTAGLLHVLAPRLAPALELLADVVTRPVFDPDELERLRAERLAALLHERTDPHALAAHAFADVLFGAAHPYGSPVGGRSDTVGRIAPEDVRRFHAAHVTPRTSFLVVAGDVDSAALIGSLDELFGGWDPGAGRIPAPVPAAPVRTRGIHVVDRPGAPQSELRIGHAGPPRSTPDYFPLHVGNTVLGGAFTSRLNMLLREEKAYTYGAGSSFAFRAGGGPFVVSTAVATEATVDAVACTARELERMREQPVSEAELARAQSYIALGLARTFETTDDIAEHVTEIALHDLGADFFDRYGAAVRAVTAADVRGAMERWLHPAELSIVIVGDAARIAGELERLDLGPVHVRAGVAEENGSGG